MKTYISIGHFKGNDNMTCVTMQQNTMKDFNRDLISNGFVSYVTMTEDRYWKLSGLSGIDMYEEVKKLTSNYRKWGDIVEYICQCYQIIEERLDMAF